MRERETERERGRERERMKERERGERERERKRGREGERGGRVCFKKIFFFTGQRLLVFLKTNKLERQSIPFFLSFFLTTGFSPHNHS